MNKLLPLRFQVDRYLKVLASHFPEPFSRDELDCVDIAGIATPRLLSGGSALNLNYREIDRFSEGTRATATVFVASGEDFVRVATSVKDQHGQRAVGTMLDRSHPGYASLRSGLPYSGYATLFGRQYMTKYEPIRDRAGEVIGVLYVGLDVSDVLTLSVPSRLASFTLVCAAAVLLSHDKLVDFASGMPRAALALLGALVIAALVYAAARRIIGAHLLEARAAAEKLATGDLTAQARVDRRDELGHLLQAVNSVGVKLSAVVMNARNNARNVSSASAQIAQGNSDLSARSEQQASALEETAASMEQLNSTVRQNADSAREANQLALRASSVAAKGGENVHQVVETMKGIDASSRKISDIIGVIDGIAFQTNILALNAAVEAARAGEQGRGFAVVASEVRSLASRSAAAAKEIKILIGASVEQVARGSALVDTAGATMTEIEDAIRRVTDLMAEISAASDEQSRSVAQVGEAVVRMEQMTQENAALVEEMAAATVGLKDQSRDLVQAVAVFKLAQD